jgi:hypothetical protein
VKLIPIFDLWKGIRYPGISLFLSLATEEWHACLFLPEILPPKSSWDFYGFRSPELFYAANLLNSEFYRKIIAYCFFLPTTDTKM